MSNINLMRLVLLGAIWGLSFIFMRIAAPMFGAIGTTLLRVTLGALVLFVVLVHRKVPLTISRHAKLYLMIGLSNTAIPFSLFAWAALCVPSAYMATMNALAPLFTAMFAWFLLDETLSVQRLCAFALGLIGVAILVGLGPAPMTMQVVLGVGAAILAAVCYGFAAIYTRRYAQGVPSLAIAVGSLTASALVLLPIFIGLSFLSPPKVFFALLQVDVSSLWIPSLAVIALGVLCTGIAYALYFKLIEMEGATKAVTVTFLVPVAASLWAVVLLRETLTMSAIGGITLVLIGTALSLRKISWEHFRRSIN